MKETKSGPINWLYRLHVLYSVKWNNSAVMINKNIVKL